MCSRVRFLKKIFEIVMYCMLRFLCLPVYQSYIRGDSQGTRHYEFHKLILTRKKNKIRK